MKIGFTLKDIQIGDKATIGEVSVNLQYDAKELVEEYALVRQIIKELPEVVADLGAGAMAFKEVDNAVDKLISEEIAEDATEETKTNAINAVKSALNKIKSEFNKAV